MFGKFFVVRVKDGKVMKTSLFPLEINKGQKLVFLSEDFSLLLPPAILHFHGSDFEVDFVSNNSVAGSTENRLSHFMVIAAPKDISEIIEAVEHAFLKASDISEEKAKQNKYLAIFKPRVDAYWKEEMTRKMEEVTDALLGGPGNLHSPFGKIFSNLFNK